MNSFLKTNYLKILCLLLILLTLYPSSYIFYKLKKTKETSSSIRHRLIELGAKSLSNLDVPVGAIITYNDSIIGTGYNTVLKDSVAFGHAEINAITMALKKLGITKFNELDRNKLFLYTTLEPCEMCRGALIEYRIKKVHFMKSKSLSYWWKERNWELVYEYNKSQITGENLQDSLLLKHPLYSK
jgi:tRNA(Arg) A34 adenosine deaminase TadA